MFVWKWRKHVGAKAEDSDDEKEEMEVAEVEEAKVETESKAKADGAQAEAKKQEPAAKEENDFRLLSGRWKVVKKQSISRDGVKARSAAYSSKTGTASPRA